MLREQTRGDAYESPLAKGAEGIESGTGQYFTPDQRRKLHDGLVSGIELVDGQEVCEDTQIERQNFIATTFNKQLSFLRDIATILAVRQGGRSFDQPLLRACSLIHRI